MHKLNKFLLYLLALFSLTGILQAAETPAPPFELVSGTGETVKLPRHTDGVDIYFFWATWCPYCKALMPHLQSIKIEYGDKVTIYALSIRDDGDPVKLIKEKGYDFIVLPKADELMPAYGLKGVPGLFIVDNKGLIQFNLYQMRSKDSAAFKAKSNKEKASLRAPWWAAAIRMKIDQVLLQQSRTSTQ